MKLLLWLQYPECALAVGFHPERMQTKHWELAAARWEQNSNKWRPGKWEDESFMAAQLSCFSEPAHLQSKLKADEPGSRTCWAPWALLLLSREMGGKKSISLLVLARTACSHLGVLEGFQHAGPLHAPTRPVFVLFCGWETKAWGRQLAPGSKAPHPSSSTLCPRKSARKIQISIFNRTKYLIHLNTHLFSALFHFFTPSPFQCAHFASTSTPSGGFSPCSPWFVLFLPS